MSNGVVTAVWAIVDLILFLAIVSYRRLVIITVIADRYYATRPPECKQIRMLVVDAR